MNSSPSPSPFLNRFWPVLVLVLAAFGVPAATITFFGHFIAEHPLLALIIGLLYEMGLLILGFLGQVGRKLQSRWVDRSVEKLDNMIQGSISHYRRYYCQYLYYQHRDFDVKGLTTVGTYTLELDRVFVELSIDPTTLKQMSSNPIQLPKALREGSHFFWDYLASKPLANQHLVIVGPPGSGKTTLLKHITLTLVAHRKLHHRHYHAKVPQKLPILLFLRDHVQSIGNQPNFSLVDALHDHLKKWEQREPPAGWIKRQLNKGRCLVMLDGLDEVADPEERQNVVNWVQTQMIAFNQNRFLVASRPFGYRSNPLSGVAVLEVRPFSLEQVERFIHQWYLANEIMSKQKDDPGVRMRARAEAKDLLQRLRNTPALFALTSNPLLLTMIATVHRYSGELPANRMALYAEICEVFLGKRQKARGQVLTLTPAQMQLVLEPLAYHLMLDGRRDITVTEAQDVIEAPLARVKLGMSPETFLQLVENASGLLVEQESGVYSFAHLTFQEYLAAAHVREKQLGDTLIAHVEDSWWRETIRLYCSMADATPIIATCLRDDHPSVFALTLALDYAEEARDVQPTVKACLESILDQGIEDTDLERRQVVAEALLARRLHQMVHVKEEIYRDTFLLTCAEYQVFLNEQQTLGKYYQPDHWNGVSFPAGSGKTPILGVRRSDAQAFCDWLTNRDREGWHYRMPRFEEWPLEERHKQKELKAETGYWVEDEPLFVWSQGRPSEALHQQLSGYIDRILDRNSTIVHGRVYERIRALIREHRVSHGGEYGLDRAIDRFLDRARDRFLDRALDLALDHDRAIYGVRMRDIARARVRDLDRALDLALDHDLILARDRDRARVLDPTLDRVLDLALADAYINVFDDDLSYTLDHALDLYITLFLLRERIAGNLPAYEGILLVKTRYFPDNEKIGKKEEGQY
jgi:energy-coupling factor transporter ATP-binding protein EcfA2